jgi:hypothetical protein
MSIGPVSSSGSSDAAVQTDFQVKQLESQIQDWTTCPTTPPETKKAIVGKLEAQLASVKKGIETRQNAVKQANADSARSANDSAVKFSGTLKVDTRV